MDFIQCNNETGNYMRGIAASAMRRIRGRRGFSVRPACIALAVLVMGGVMGEGAMDTSCVYAEENTSGWRYYRNFVDYPEWREEGSDLAGLNWYEDASTIASSASFSLAWSRENVTGMRTGDVDGDGILELVAQYGTHIAILDGQGQEQNSFDIAAGNLDVLEDFNGDGAMDILFRYHSSIDQKFYIKSYDYSGNILQTFSKASSGGGMQAVARASNGDLLASMSVGARLDPRGWAAFDVGTGMEKWYYDVGPGHLTSSVADFDGDDLLELVNMGLTFNNGATGTGKDGVGTPTRDDSLYTIVIDENGVEEWTVGYAADGEWEGRVAGKFADLDGDGTYEVLVFEGHDPTHYPGTSQIHLLNPANGQILATFDGSENVDWVDIIVADLNGDGKKEILAREDSETFYILDDQLTSLQSGQSAMHLVVANDLDGDGEVEVIARLGSGVYVLDGTLGEKWHYQTPADVDMIAISDLNGDGGNELLVLANSTLYALSAEPVMQLSDDQLVFGKAATGTPSTLPLTISNTGDATLNVTDITLAVATPVFSVAPTAFSLAPGESQQVDVTFSPTGVDWWRDSLVFHHNASSRSDTVALSGSGSNGSIMLSDAVLIHTFAVPDNGEIHHQDALTWDGSALWAVSHTDDQHHYLNTLTTAGALIEQFPTNSVNYSGMVTGLAYRPGYGPLAKIRKRIYTINENAERLAELGSTSAHHSIAFDARTNTVISLTAVDGAVHLIFKDIDMQVRPEWGDEWWYYNENATVNTSQAAGYFGGASFDGRYLFFAYGGVYQVDISDIDDPRIVDVLEMPEGEVPVGITVAGDRLYVGVRNYNTGQLNTVQVYDLLMPELDLSASALVFGKVDTGTTNTLSLTVANTGDAPLDITDIACAGATPVFSVASTSVSIASGGSQEMAVTFSPTAVGWAQDYLVLTHNASTSPDTVDLSGIGRIAPPTGLLSHTRLVLQTGRDGNLEIYTVESDGSNPTNLTQHSADDLNPDWSPDGTKVVFDSDRDGNLEVYAMDADGSNPVNLTNNGADDRDPVWSPDGTRIVFFSSRDGDYEIFAMDADGGNVSQLTSNSALDAHPSWSPDGTKVAFQSDRDGNAQIYAMDADGTNQVRLTNNEANDRHPAWSPDGTQIAFHSDRSGSSQVHVMDADGTNATQLTVGGGVDAGWSPDGTMLAFVSMRSGVTKTYTINADGTDETLLSEEGESDAEPSWSPFFRAPEIAVSNNSLDFGEVEGWRLASRAFTVSNAGDTTLTVASIVLAAPSSGFSAGATAFTLEPEESREFQILFRPREEGTLQGKVFLTHDAESSPDSVVLTGVGRIPDLPEDFLADSRIAFAGEGDGSSEVFLLGPDLASTQLSSGLSPSERGLSWSPYGRRIAFTSNRDGNSEIYLVDNDGSDLTRFTGDGERDYNPVWSPDGMELLFGSRRDGDWEIFSIGADGTGLTQLTANEIAADWGPSWSPDGTQIAFQSGREDNNEIWRMDADGGNPARLTSNAVYDDFPVWSPDGTRIAFHSGGTLCVMDADGGNLAQLADSMATAPPVWSPDGTQLIYAGHPGTWQTDIFAINVDGTHRFNLTGDPSSDKLPVWSPDGTRIAFLSDRDGRWMVYTMAADGSDLVQLAGPASAFDGSLAWSPLLTLEETTRAAGITAEISIAAGDSLQIFSIGLTGNGFTRVESLSMTLDDVSPATGLTAQDIVQLNAYCSTDAELTEDDSFLVRIWSDIHIGEPISIPLAVPDIIPSGEERFYLVEAITGAQGVNGHAFQVHTDPGFVATSSGGVGTAVVPTAGQKVTLVKETAWELDLQVTNGAAETRGLGLGLAPGGTEELDPLLGELELPPPPPAEEFDVRFALAGLDGLARDWRSSSSWQTVWQIDLQAGQGGYPVQLAWDPQVLPEGCGLFLQDGDGGEEIFINMKRQASFSLEDSGVDQLKIIYVAQGSFTYQLSSRWNLVSLPIRPVDNGVDRLFPDAISAFEYDGVYHWIGRFVPGKGYWLNLEEGGTYTVEGIPLTSCDTTLTTGWSLVGTPWSTTGMNAIGQEPDDILLSVFGFAGRYVMVDELLPGGGYWVNLGQAGTLNLAPGPAAKPLAALRPGEFAADGWMRFAGEYGWQEILLGVDRREVVAYPPLPPPGVFDARVELGDEESCTVPAAPAGEEHALQVRGGDLRIAWDVADAGGRSWELVLGNRIVALTGGGEVAVDGFAGEAILRQSPVGGLPQDFSLEQNYPNPFNSQTTLVFSLPGDERVTVDLFDVQGQHVRSLLDAVRTGGTHRLIWDGRDEQGRALGSGVFFFRMRAGDYQAVRKLILLK